MKYRWHLPDASSNGVAAALAAALGIGPFLAQCLANRGVCQPESAARFLRPRLADLSDPLLLPNMAAALDRLLQARSRGENTVIFGDYDVDGVTSVALLLETLRALGWNANYYLPRRLDEGYGLTREAAGNCLEKFPSRLLLAVDCGSTSVETIAWLAQEGTDVVVLDHHQVSTPPPAAVALVNPRLAASLDAAPGGAGTVEMPAEGSQPTGLRDGLKLSAASPAAGAELCSAGLAFKLAHALLKRLRAAGEEAALKLDLRQFLDLVALGTIADIVPLTGENRIFASAGLGRLNTTQRPGLVALKAVAQSPSPVGAYEVAFQLGPRLNAAGRLEDAEESLRLLLAPDAAAAEPLARRLDVRNRERQDIERAIAEEVMAAIAARHNWERDWVIVEGRDSWHIGVVGIVAARVVRRFYRPAIIMGGDGGHWRGSGRSIEGFDLAAALRGCDDLLVRHGGHSMAAGLTAQPGQVEPLRRRINDLARLALRPEQLEPSLRLDGEITGAALTLEAVEELEELSPTGQDNPPPQWVLRGLRQCRQPRRMGQEFQHVKLYVTDGRQQFEAVWWNCGQAALPDGRFDLACTAAVNEYQGIRAVQLKVLDWRPAASP